MLNFPFFRLSNLSLHRRTPVTHLPLKLKR
jgi:hypothetical protein